MDELSTILFDEQHMPKSILEIAMHCGKGAALTLLTHYPGVHLSIPKTPRVTHKLAELLGTAAFKKLCDIYGSEVIYVPKGSKTVKEDRNQKILHEFSEGVKQSIIAVRYGITERQVNKICNGTRMNHAKTTYFD